MSLGSIICAGIFQLVLVMVMLVLVFMVLKDK
jgi:hypothetical protein